MYTNNTTTTNVIKDAFIANKFDIHRAIVTYYAKLINMCGLKFLTNFPNTGFTQLNSKK